MSNSLTRRAVLTGLSAGLSLPLLGLPLASHAQDWPGKPIRIVVPFPAGGATDTSARMLAEQLATRLRTTVTVDNKPGGATIIGVDAVAKAPADGNTLLVAGVGSFAVLPGLRSKLPFDMERDFSPIALVSYTPVVIVTSADKPYRTLADALAAAKAQPGVVRYASYGAGSAPHLAGELLSSAAGVTLEGIPYKGAADAQVALVRGDVDLGFETLSAVSGQIKAGKLRVLAMDGAKRSSLLPEVPALTELGLGAAAMDAYYGVMVASATPAPIRARLSKEITEIMATPEMRERSLPLFLEVSTQGPDALASLVKVDTARFRAIGQRLKLQLD